MELARRFKMKPSAQPDRNAAPGTATAPDLGPALDLLWTRFLTEIRTRVDLLEAAASACGANQLSAAERDQAHAAAHKLAGTLGTFNLARGTDLAREFELAVFYEGTPAPALAERLAAIAAELRTLIDGRG